MKNVLTILCVISMLISCNDENEDDNLINTCVKVEEVHHGYNGLELTLQKQSWYILSNDLGGVSGGVSIAGTVVGDYAVIETYGDGLHGNAEISLSAQGEFDQNFETFFTSSLPQQDSIIVESVILVIQAHDTLRVAISSLMMDANY